MTCKNVALLAILIGTVQSLCNMDDLVISLSTGKVRGTKYMTGNNNTYYGFQGIPYAIPPLGQLRFEPPRPAESWSGIFDATQDGKVCITRNYLQLSDGESEDCLFINVYTPNLKPEEKLSVMFWVYGGGFVEGSSTKPIYGPDFLVEKNVILVTFNYRLGPFGFLSTGDEVLPGNVGLKDQNLALKWTSQNIVKFGGDPEKITIFGQSAGGASIGLHLISKLSAGLFRAAIVQSGSAVVAWSVDRDPKTKAYIIADGIPGGTYENDTHGLTTFLKNSTVEEIMTGFSLLPEGVDLLPTVEVKTENAFITDESHYTSLESGNFNRVPILIGICSQESLYDLKDLNFTKQVAFDFDIMPATLIPVSLDPISDDVTALVEEIKAIYLQENETFSSDLTALLEYFSDNSYSRGVVKHAELSSNYVPVYLYQFAYYGRPVTPFYLEGAEKVSHAAELPFLFNITGISGTTDANDILTQNRVVTIWTNFAKYLNPSPEKSPILDNIVWPTTDSQTLKYLNINQTLEVRSNIRANSYQRWNDIFDLYGKKPFITF